ncbi:helicase RepA family protein [Acidithiobacillus ferrooxidans]|uniref:helicase RepA family protein n=1 Tax=Acidithiobacillus ferrooxidans TaxID=920 RepID=UPI00214BF031|nr:helicase RepA family protein [Acidithiobacillus ferrooxidans]MCR2831232.1 helicase RepA family protein [Acidithiobacillus ferrooxidans]
MSDLRDFPSLRGLTEPDDLPPLDAYDELVEQPTPRLSVVPAGPSAGADELPEPQPARPPLLRHVRDLLTNPPAVRWLIRGIVEQDSLTVIYGPSGQGKSFVALGMASSIATGSEWFDAKTSQGPVVYLAGEGYAGIGRRLRVWQLTNPDARLEDAPLFVSRRIVAMANGADALAEIDAAITEAGAGKPSVVFVDTLARAAVGLDENSAADMGMLMSACDEVRHKYDCCVVIIHHTGHDASRARGSSAIKGTLDTEIQITRDGQAGPIEMKSTKAKESEGFAPFYFQLKSTDTGWVDEDMQPVYSAILERAEKGGDEGQSEQLGKNQTLCLGVLKEMYGNRRTNLEQGGRSPHDAKISLTEWREGSGLIRQRFNESKAALIKRGLVTIQGSIVSLPEANERERNANEASESFGGNKRTERNGGSIEPVPSVRTRDANPSPMAVLENILRTGGNPLVGDWQRACILAGITGGVTTRAIIQARKAGLVHVVDGGVVMGAGPDDASPVCPACSDEGCEYCQPKEATK